VYDGRQRREMKVAEGVSYLGVATIATTHSEFYRYIN
jgi:hypothetical protein